MLALRSIRHKILFAAIAISAIAAPATVSAQPLPSYAAPAPHEEVIRGTISDFDGAYILYLRDVRGFIDHVTLHQGTVINPTGLRLQQGMTATISGYANGPTFEANVIDTPYPPSVVYYQNWGSYWYGGWGPWFYGGGYWGGYRGGYWGGYRGGWGWR